MLPISFFVKGIAIALVVCMSVSFEFAYCFYKKVSNEKIDSFSTDFQGCINSVKKLNSFDESSVKWCISRMNYTAYEDVALSFVDLEQNKTIYTDGIVYYIDKNLPKSNDKSFSNSIYYYENSELTDKINEELKKYQYNIVAHVEFDKIYLKDNMFTASTVTVNFCDTKAYDYGEINGNFEKTIVETKKLNLSLPDKIDEYKIVDNPTSVYYLGVNPNSKGLEKLKSYNYFDGYMANDKNTAPCEYEYSSNSTYKKGVLCMEFHANFTHSENVYRLNMVCCYNFFDEYGKTLINRSLIVSAVLLLIAALVTYIAYLKYKKKYQINEYRKNLTNTMAHDLKSPLTVISGYAENLADNVNTDKKDIYAGAIIENTKYINGIIEDVLGLATLETDNIKLIKSRFDIVTATRNLFSKYETNLSDKNITLEIDGSKTVYADKTKLLQALENLISNAVKYTPEDGRITVHASKNDFSISNTVTGLFETDLANLAEPFVKDGNSRSERKGTGLGLTIVKRIVDMHNAKLELDCNKGIFTAKIVF